MGPICGVKESNVTHGAHAAEYSTRYVMSAWPAGTVCEVKNVLK